MLLGNQIKRIFMAQKIMLITGASRGIGSATAILAAQRGYMVCINYLKNTDVANALVKKITSSGGNAIAIQADVSNESEVVTLFKKIDSEFGAIHALINNAGVLDKQMRVVDMNAARIERMFKSNVLSCFLCAREAIKRMSTENNGAGGSIVNVSSRAAILGAANEYVDYAASKGAVDTLTIGLSREVANQGIRVNAVRPGLIETEMHASGGEPGRVKRLAYTLPMQRGGQPEEVAAAILWLLSEEASYVTGAFIDVSGGR